MKVVDCILIEIEFRKSHFSRVYKPCPHLVANVSLDFANFIDIFYGAMLTTRI